MISRIFPALALIASLLLSTARAAEAPVLSLEKLAAAPAFAAAPLHIGGRVVAIDAAAVGPAYRFQWPGEYFETAFSGSLVCIRIGEGDAIYHVRVDGGSAATLVKPAPGVYAVRGVAPGTHTLRVEVASESQAAPAVFGGILAPADAAAHAPAARARRIEFIGDSHTVGYGNTSPKRECTPAQVWLTTDTSQAFGPLVAAHFDADYEVNAISGRGIVRNYNGSPGATLPAAYPFALFDGRTPVADAGWQPQVVVVGLGTNDFSTALNPGEKWKTRDELHADYEATYVAFLQLLRARHPDAFFILAATDMAEGEIAAEARKVAERMHSAGDARVTFVAYPPLELTACDWHPSLADHRKMAQTLIDYLEVHPDVWGGR